MADPQTLSWEYQISPTNKSIIERRALVAGARWGFYKRADSPNDAQRSLAVIRGEKGQDEK